MKNSSVAFLLSGAVGAILLAIGLRLTGAVRSLMPLVIIVLIGFLGAVVASVIGAVGNKRPNTFAKDCLLGAPMLEAKQMDFFIFFNLEETGSTNDAATGRKIVIFKPAGEAFRPLVRVNVALATDDRIAGIDLFMRRDFVNSPTNGVFARDIAKSLLRSALPATDRTALSDLINAIEYRQHSSNARPAIVGPGYKPPPLPAQPTAGYQTYLGQRPLFEQTLSSGGRLRIENTETDGAKTLIIALR